VAKKLKHLPLREERGATSRNLLVGVGITGATVLAILTIAIVVLWGIAMPVRDLPDPTGPHAVGTVSYDLVDIQRHDPYRIAGSPAPESRTIRLQLWYPAAPSATARPEPWMPDGPDHTRAIVRSHGFPFFIWEHTRWMDSNSYRNAPAAGPSHYPVVIIVHGWEGYRGLHADIAEDLASHGYLVAAADHSYGAAATRLSDGTLLRSREDVLPKRNTTDRFVEYANELVETFSRDIGSIHRHLEDLSAGRTIQVVRGDSTGGDPSAETPVGIGSVSTAEREAALAAVVQLEGRIDLDRLALVGHSTGGGAAVHYALEHGSGVARHHTLGHGDISAVVGLDAWVEPLGHTRLSGAKLSMPTLFLRSTEWIDGINDRFLVPFVERLQEEGAPVELRQMEGITHEQFSTLYMYAPATRWVGLMGEADPWEFATIQRRAIREFLVSIHNHVAQPGAIPYGSDS
jgi:dienelactone hydrolase